MAVPPLPSVLHPMFVHFTVALVPFAAGLATWNAVRPAPWTRPATYALLLPAGFLALLTMGSGFREYFLAKPGLDGEPLALLEIHEMLGVVTAITVAVTAAVAWWRRRDVSTSRAWRWALALALLAASALVLVTAWYGGSLVYDHGIAVTDTTPHA